MFSHGTGHRNRSAVRHPGAWRRLEYPGSLRPAHIEGVRRSYRVALDALRRGAPPLDAVIDSLVVLEDDPAFDAGTGSFLNEDGKAELDAAVMVGADLRAGAVAAVGRFRNPSVIARAVMERTDHVLLIAEGAERFALAQGFAPVDPASLVNAREFEGYEAWVRAGRPDARVFFDEEGKVDPREGGRSEQDKRGTVGIVLGVRASAGDLFTLFAGTSTGGTRGKKAGRVGDVPLIGCGIYADDEGAAVCCTGWGEAFVRAAAAKSVSERCTRGDDPQEAVEAVLAFIHRRTGGRGGIMAVDARGRAGAAFTTPDMAYAGSACRHVAM